jgi:hypothetical protein
MFQSINLFVGTHAGIILTIVLVWLFLLTVFILMFHYSKNGEREMPHYSIANSEQTRKYGERRQREYEKRMKDFFDSLPAATEPVQHFKSGEGWVK